MAPLLFPVAAAFVLFGMAIAALIVALFSLVQRLAPAELQGRTYAAASTLINTPQAMSIALGAALITAAGYRTLLVAMSAVMGSAALYLLSHREQRHRAPRVVPALNPPAPSHRAW